MDHLTTDGCPVCVCCIGFHDAFSGINPDSTEQTFDLGNNQTTTNVEEAFAFVLQRDFSEYQFEDDKQKEILFTPPHYLHKRMDLQELPKAEKEGIFQVIKKDKPDLMTNIESEDFEKFVFDSFKMFLTKNFENQATKNITVLQGWKRTWNLLHKVKGVGDEHDLIIIDGNRKLIILFEDKASVNANTSKKASKQLQSQVEYFQNYHGHVLTPEWKIASVIVHQNIPENPICQKCKFFVLDKSCLSNLSKWWQKLGENLEIKNSEVISSPEDKKDCYKRLIGRIVGLSSTSSYFVSTVEKYRTSKMLVCTGSKDPVSSSMPTSINLEKDQTVTGYGNVSPQETNIGRENQRRHKLPKAYKFPFKKDELGDEKIKFFLSPQQRELLMKKNTTRMIIRGEPGTGKSLLLKLKAIEIAKTGQKVYYIIGFIHNEFEGEPLFYGTRFLKPKYFYEMTKRELECYGIEVVLSSSSGIHIHSLSKKIKDGHIFWDEFYVHVDLPELFSKMINDKINGRLFWIAEANTTQFCVPNYFKSLKSLHNFGIVELDVCFRNSQNIQNFVKVLKNKSDFKYSNQESDHPVTIFYNRTMAIALEQALQGYANDYVIYISAVFSQTTTEVREIIKDMPGWNVMEWNEFLDPNNASIKPGTLVVADPKFSSMGIEAKNVIVAFNDLMFNFVEKMCHFSNRNFLMRAVAHLTLLIEVKRSSEDEILEFKNKINNVSKVIDLR